mmetsp:Transcript_100033/g.173611  ORF Transcript_100033/g.173611 Transcript_100033/m.173611 type:complete len:435 (+) Transcript_100033:83-1387(+)
MVRAARSCILLLLLLGPSGAAAAAAGQSKPIFPALRHKLEQKHEVAEAKKNAPKANSEEVVEPAHIVVPAPVDVGSNGFPVLPAVSQMMGEASSTLKNVNSKAKFLESRVVQAQTESETRMAKQKAAFERKLKAQEQGNRAVIAESANISAAISKLKKENDALRLHAKELQDTNRVMRTELHALETRLSAARDFAGHSLVTTDDSKASELNVLQVQGHLRHKHDGEDESDDSTSDDSTDDSDDSDADKDSDSSDNSKEEESFMELSSTVRRSGESSNSFEAELAEMEAVTPSLSQPQRASSDASPGHLLEELSREVANLAKQEKSSEKQLKELFIRDFRAGARRHQALLAQQHGLNFTRGGLVALQTKLKAAESHLESTRSQLEQRLHGVGIFMQRLAHLALAPEREVKHLLETLPKSPSIATHKVSKVHTQTQ